MFSWRTATIGWRTVVERTGRWTNLHESSTIFENESPSFSNDASERRRRSPLSREKNGTLSSASGGFAGDARFLYGSNLRVFGLVDRFDDRNLRKSVENDGFSTGFMSNSHAPSPSGRRLSAFSCKTLSLRGFGRASFAQKCGRSSFQGSILALTGGFCHRLSAVSRFPYESPELSYVNRRLPSLGSSQDSESGFISFHS